MTGVSRKVNKILLKINNKAEICESEKRLRTRRTTFLRQRCMPEIYKDFKNMDQPEVDLFNHVYKIVEIPEEWLLSTFIPIPKTNRASKLWTTDSSD